MKEWIIAFNNAKTLETNGEASAAIIEEYERVIKFLKSDNMTEAETRIWNEACRNLYELYALENDTEKAAYYESQKMAVDDIKIEEEEI